MRERGGEGRRERGGEGRRGGERKEGREEEGEDEEDGGREVNTCFVNSITSYNSKVTSCPYIYPLPILTRRGFIQEDNAGQFQ